MFNPIKAITNAFTRKKNTKSTPPQLTLGANTGLTMYRGAVLDVAKLKAQDLLSKVGIAYKASCAGREFKPFPAKTGRPSQVVLLDTTTGHESSPVPVTFVGGTPYIMHSRGWRNLDKATKDTAIEWKEV